MPRFSGKLSYVMPTCDDQIRIDPEQPPALGTPNAPGQHGGAAAPLEVGGREGPDPTRFGDWEFHGRCIDF